ncbi:hypothetical protein LguiA_005064 [Lonicera macranthoides]
MRDGERLAKKGNRVQRKRFRKYVGVAGLVVVVFSGVHAADRSKSRKVIFDIEVMASQLTSRMTRCMFHLAKGEFSDNPWLELRGRGRGLEPVISSIEGQIWSTTEFKHLNCRISVTPKLVICFDKDLAQGYLN